MGERRALDGGPRGALRDRTRRPNPDQPRPVWLVTVVNFVGALDALHTVAPLLEAHRSGRAMAPELPFVVWPMELWIASILFSQWAARNQRPSLAVIVPFFRSSRSRWTGFCRF